MRAFMPGRALAGTLAVITGLAAVPLATAVRMSAAPNSRPMSDGLIGVAWTRTTTSSGCGAGTAVSTSESCSSPSAVISERSCRLLWGAVMAVLRWGDEAGVTKRG